MDSVDVVQRFAAGADVAGVGADADLRQYMQLVAANGTSAISAARERHFLDALLQRQRLTRAELARERVCATCNVRYRETKNIGQWQCWRHMSAYDNIQGMWLCCARIDRSAIGCMRSDHIEEGEARPANAAVQVPRFLQPVLDMPRADAAVPASAQQKLTVMSLVAADDPCADATAYLQATSALYARASYLQTLVEMAPIWQKTVGR